MLISTKYFGIAYRCVTHNAQYLGTTQMSMNWQVSKHNVAYPYNGKLCDYRKKLHVDTGKSPFYRISGKEILEMKGCSLVLSD